jgi:43 kDa relaxation protein
MANEKMKGDDLMASYHFRLKSDKKPNGMRVLSTDHIAYVRREGKFRDIDSRRVLQIGSYKNTIYGTHPIIALPKKPMLLYSSPYGNIKLDASGIHVSHRASAETQAIALSVAQKIFGDELDVQGDTSFVRSLLIAERDLSLGVHFLDTDLERENEKLQKEREEIEWQRGLTQGYAVHAGQQHRDRRDDGNGWSKRCGIRKFSDLDDRDGAELFQSDTDESPAAAKAEGRLHLHVLPGGDVARQRRRRHLLLSDDEKRDIYLGGGRQRACLALRWSLSRRRRSEIEKAANSILGVLQKNIDGDLAFAHLQYINREAAFTSRGGCLAVGHHLPQWAQDSPLRFFHAADRFERVGGERYKEIVFSLPQELTLEQNREILDRFLEKHLAGHYYAWAVHEKVGAMSDGERHPHVHIMFSTREMDAVERTKERTPENFFRRANAEHPERGGCPKAEKWIGKDRRDYLLTLREDYARIQNEVLEKYNIPVRVSHLCLEAQKMQAEMRGDWVLAEILDRLPEDHTSPTSIVRDDDVVRRQKQLRKFNDQRTDKIIRRALHEDAEREDEAEQMLSAAQKTHDLLHTEIIAQYSKQDKEEIESLRAEMDAARKELDVLSASLVWGKDALEEARLDFLGEEGRAAWEDVMTLRRDLHEAEEFSASFHLPPDATEDEDVAMGELEIAMHERIQKLTRDYKAAAKKLQPHLKKLSERGTHKNIQKRINEYLFRNELPKARYMKALKAYSQLVEKTRCRLDEVRAGFAVPNKYTLMRDDLSLTLDDAAAMLRHAKQHADEQVRMKAAELAEAKKEVLSYERIIQIAENVYEHGGIKRLRERERKLAKDETYLANDQEKLESDERAFAAKPVPSALAIFGNQREDYTKEKQELADRRAAIEERARHLAEERDDCARLRQEIEERREMPEAEQKIQQIAVGVMRKNWSAVVKVKKITAELHALREKSDAADAQIDAVDGERDRRGGSARYRPASKSGGSPMDDARALADHLRSVPRAVQLVAKDRKDRMDDNWALLSTFERDEIAEESSPGR